jgi:hypothetical protein
VYKMHHPKADTQGCMWKWKKKQSCCYKLKRHTNQS